MLSKFPGHRSGIVALYNMDEDFLGLCEDNLTSIEAMEKRRKDLIKDREMERGYLQLNRDLEKEILNFLGKKC
ncbi:hypothetical protein [Pollutibacter soli]|uniref:hypothetical protein n=1 Tax=Pollutibacter soli TaxID=3034157 RepID=UPI00301395D5